MTLQEYKHSIQAPLKPRTVTFLLKDNKVLLGFKKRGFGKGNFIGIGGKVEDNETIETAASREIAEEISVRVSHLEHKGIVNFYFPKESWNQKVHIFTAVSWSGEPKESEEIKPQWFSFETLPFESMWDDAMYWIPKILSGETVNGEFLFNEELMVIDSSLS